MSQVSVISAIRAEAKPLPRASGRVPMKAKYQCFVLGLALPILALPCFAQESRESGYQKTYTIHADGAWIAPGEVLEPAFVTLRNGVISRVSREAPREQKGVFGLGG